MNLNAAYASADLNVRLADHSERTAWDDYVYRHPQATLYHLFGWRHVINRTYGHDGYYLLASDCSHGFERTDFGSASRLHERVVGVLPLIHMKHILFGNSLISMPFLDFGGVLADDGEVESRLLLEAVRLGIELKVNRIELRHVQPVSSLGQIDNRQDLQRLHRPLRVFTRTHKVRMLLPLPASSDGLMGSFKSKLRSQIRKPVKEGLVPRVGGAELLEDFYRIFKAGMRDLGSPVHSKELMRSVLQEFPDQSRIVAVYKDEKPLAASLVIGFRDTLENPWASSLREYVRFSPNMLLYMRMLQHACDSGFAYFDFGRSSPDEGTYNFKKQWGAKQHSLYWHYISLDGRPVDTGNTEKSRFKKIISCWQKLPIAATVIIGPMIRKHIGL